jgi:SPP1 family predicted phage head-tail adaptor
MTDPGRLGRRLVLEAPVETPDGAGGVSRGYETVATIWAEVTPLSARGEVVAADAGATRAYRILVRVGPDITSRHRLRDGARVFRIVSVRAADASRRFVEIRAEEWDA